MNNLVDKPGWIYICMDIKNPDECKIGSTRRPLYDRITETGNPDYMIVKAYQVPPAESLQLEKHLQREVGKVGARKPHVLSGKKSEWFAGDDGVRSCLSGDDGVRSCLLPCLE